MVTRPVLVYAVACETCGWSYPPDPRPRAVKTDLEAQIRYHRLVCADLVARAQTMTEVPF